MQEGLCDPDDVPEPPDEAIDPARRSVDSRRSPAALRRQLEARGRGPPARRRHDPPGEHRPAVQRQGRAAEQQRHRRGPVVVPGRTRITRDSTSPGIPAKSKPTRKKLRAKDRPLANDFVTDEAFDAMLLDAGSGTWRGCWSRAGRFYIWGGYANFGNYPPALKASGLYFSQAIIWDKQHPVLTRKDFMGALSGASTAGRRARPQVPRAEQRHRSVARQEDQSQQMVHLTEKPVELAVRAMQYSSRPGENVLDLFGGSGSTLIAAEQTGRKAFLMELDPSYCDVIADRFQRFTGKPAILERTGESPLPMKPGRRACDESQSRGERSRRLRSSPDLVQLIVAAAVSARVGSEATAVPVGTHCR